MEELNKGKDEINNTEKQNIQSTLLEMVKEVKSVERIDNNTIIPGEIVLGEGEKLIEKYFEFSGFTADIIEAFDNWIENRLGKQLLYSPIVLMDGTKVIVSSVRFEKPSITVDGNNKLIYPAECRNKISYLFTIWGYFKRIREDKDPNTGLLKVTVLESDNIGRELGKIPAMLGSVLCNLRGKTDEEKLMLGECPRDPLGYYITYGNEKIMEMTERLRQRKLSTIFDKKNRSYECKLQYRDLSTIEYTKLQLYDNIIKIEITGFPVNKQKSDDEVKDFCLKRNLCCLQIFRLLGITDINEIKKYLNLFINPKWKSKIMFHLNTSFIFIESISDDIEWMLLDNNFKDCILGKDREEKKNNIITSLLKKFFPHMKNESLQYKLFLLSYMIIRFVEIVVGLKEPDDRDNWSNKKVETSALSMEKLFGQIWKEQVDNIKKELNKNTSKIYSLDNVTSKINRNKFLDDYLKCFRSGIWCLKKNTKTQTVMHLKRENLVATLSHLSRISIKDTPKGSGANSNDIRMVNLQQYGFISAEDSPEGEQVGITKYKAYTAFISINRNDTIVSLLLKDYLISVPKETQNTVCLLNGKFMGWCNGCETKDFLISKRRNLTLYRDSSIIYDKDENTLFIYTDDGRLTRPLLIVDKDGELIIDKKKLWEKTFIELLREGAIEYIDIFEQESNSSLLAFSVDDVRERKIVTKKLLEKRSNVIELIENYKNNELLEENNINLLNTYNENINEIKKKLSDLDNEYLEIIKQKKEKMFEEVNDYSERVERVKVIENFVKRENEIISAITNIKYELKNKELEGFTVNVEDMKLTELNNLLELTEDEILKDNNKKKYTHSELSPDALLSIAASIIPLPETSAATKISFQSCMSRQALGIYHSNQNLRFDTNLKTLAFPTRPLFETHMNKVIGLDDLPTGQMVLVAMKLQGGDNMEDGIIMNQGSIDRGLLTYILYPTYDAVMERTPIYKDKFERPIPKPNEKEGKYSKIDNDGLPIVGRNIECGDAVIGRTRLILATGEVKNMSILAESQKHGIVERVIRSRNQEGLEIILVKLRQVRRPQWGDKFACLTPDHKVLTIDGWKNINLIQENDKVATLGNDGFISYNYPSKIYNYDYNGKMYNISSPDNVSLVTTPNHRMWVRPEGEFGYEFIKSSEIIWKNVSYSSNIIRQEVDDSNFFYRYRINDIESFLKFYGMWLMNNFYNKTDTISYTFSSIEEYNYIVSLLDKNNIIYNFNNNKTTILFDESNNTNELLKDIRLAKWCYNLNTTNTKILISGLIEYQTIRKINNDKYKFIMGIGDREFIEKVLILFLYARFNTVIVEGNNMLCLKINYNKSDNFISHNINTTKEYFSEYNGKVYCLEVPNEKFMVLHNGIAVWTGNSRYAQKGTITRILPEEEMPYIVGTTIRPDIIVNPHSIPGRMTVGWLIEILMSKVAVLQGEKINATAFKNFNYEDFEKVLIQYGADKYGMEELFDPVTNKVIPNKIFMGPCYYQALKHHSLDKIQGRNKGTYSLISRQPVRSFSSSEKNAGLKIGEQERDALVSHGASAILQERLCISSDAYTFPLCTVCNQIAIYNVETNQLSCNICSSDAKFVKCTTPFSFKLLSQILGAANINFKLGVRYPDSITSDIIDEELDSDDI